MKRLAIIVLLGTGLVSPAFSQTVDSLKISGTRIDVDLYGNIFVVDAARNLLSVYSSTTGDLLNQMGGEGWGNEQFDRPVGISAWNGIDVFVADYGNHRIQRFDRGLNFISSFSTRGADDLDIRFGYPGDVVLSRLGDLFICDTENGRILKVNNLSQVEKIFGGYDAGAGRLVAPSQVEIGPKDVVYVLDENRILMFDVFGNFVQELMPGLFRRPSAIFATPDEVLVLDRGMLFLFDQENRPAPAVSIAEITAGFVKGGEVMSLGVDRDKLFLLTTHDLYVVRRPPTPKN
jgi:hypothetical protein